MHVKTQVRKAMQRRLIAAGVAGGRVYTRDPRNLDPSESYVLIEPETERSIETNRSTPRFARSVIDNVNRGRTQKRTFQVSLTGYAVDAWTLGADGNPSALVKDADEVADDLTAAIEAALFDGDNRLVYVDESGAEQRLGELDFALLGTGAVRNPETGARLVGVVHMLFEVVLVTCEGDPTKTLSRL